MQVDLIHLLYALLISWIILALIKYFNKKCTFRNRECDNLKKQIETYHLDTNVTNELYGLIEKYFKVRACYLRPNDNIKIFYDLSSFDLHENYEDFVNHMTKEFNIEVEPKDKLIDLMIKMQQNSCKGM